MFARQNGAVNTNIAILHPNIFYFVLDASWSSINSLEYWNKGNTATTVNNNTVHKTIYAPDPINFTEPKSASFTGFSITGTNTSILSQINKYGSYNKGWNFFCLPNFTGSTIFFPALGFRDISSARENNFTAGTLVYTYNYGHFWSTIPSSTSTYARLLGFYSVAVLPQYEVPRAFAFNIYSVFE